MDICSDLRYNPPVMPRPMPDATSVSSLYRIDRTTLPNGLQVWAKERPGTGTIAAVLVVRVGARVEDRATSGLSHFLEHLLFDGTERWDESEIRQVIERIGGFFNGWTGYEGTGYEVEVEAKHLSTALDWLAEIAFRSTLPPDKVRKERNILFQEKGGRLGAILNFFLDLCDRLGIVYNMRREVVRRLFPGSRLEESIIGRDRSLSRITRQQLWEHYRRYYIPNNMVLIVVGDVPSAKVFAEAERYFGGFPAGELPAPPPASGPPPGRFINVRVRWPYWIDRALVRLGARTVGLRDKDRYPLAVLGWMLADRLWTELREEKGLVYGVGAYNHEYTDGGYFTVETDFDGAQLETIVTSIKRELDDLKEGRFDDESLARAKEVLRGRTLLSLDSNYELAAMFTEPALYLGPDEPVPDHFAEIEAVTREDVQRVAQTYFRQENSYQALFRPAFTLREALIGGGAAVAVAVPLLFWMWRRRRHP
jgi:predicted Zn-dependent peptidase